MKVHVVYIDNGGSGGDTFVARNGDDESDDDDEMNGSENGENEAIQSPAQRSGPDFSSEPGFDILAGKVKGLFFSLLYFVNEITLFT